MTPFPDTGALVGGTTATGLDSKRASAHDRNHIILLILVMVSGILGLLLQGGWDDGS